MGNSSALADGPLFQFIDRLSIRVSKHEICFLMLPAKEIRMCWSKNVLLWEFAEGLTSV